MIIPSAQPIASAPVAALVEILPPAAVGTPNVVDDAVCLLEIEVFQGGGTTVLPPAPIGSSPIGGFALGAKIPSGVAVLTYSDAGWIGEPDDADKPNALYLGRATTPFQFERDCPVVPEQDRRLQVQYGQTVIAAGDGALDAALDAYAVAGRPVTVRRARRGYPNSTAYADHAVVLAALATDWTQDENSVTIDLRDKAYQLDLPLQSSLYAGTGGAEGDAQFEGKPKPCLFGFRRNITPDFIDQGNLIYRFHFRQAEAVTAVRDLGAALTAGDDYASYDDLAAASVSSGTFATCLAEGLVKVGTSPTALTIDAKGDADGGYVDTHGAIARKILLGMGALTNGDFVSSSFGDWPSGTAGYFVSSGDTPTITDAIDALAASVAGWWGPQRDGRIAAGRLFDPDSMEPDLEIGLADLRDQVSALALPSLPRYRQRVGYQEIETVQQGSDLAGSVSAADRAYYSQQYRSVTAIDTDVQTRYPLAADYPVLISLFDGAADAQTLADLNLGLHKAERRMFSVPVGPLSFFVDLGKVVRLTYPRFQLQNGQNFVVVGITEDSTGGTLTIWG